MNNSYNYIIVGGGLLGCSTAYQLAKRGVKNIAVFDRNEIASQASARAACLLTRARTKEVQMHLVQETYNCIEEIEKMTGESLGVQNCGSITIASSTQSLEGLEALERAATNFGIANVRVDKERVKSLVPWLETKDIIDSLYMPTDGFIDSALLCSGYATAAKMLGVEFYSNCGVKEIVSTNNIIKGIVLDNDKFIESPIVINSAGAWANILMKPLSVGLPLTPVRSHFWISDIDKDQFPINHPFTVIPDAKAFTRSDVGALMIGLRESQCQPFNAADLTESLEDFDFECGAKWSILEECAPMFKKFLPQIEELGIAHYVSGPSCYVPDATYVIGEIKSHKGLYTIAGCCGAGVASGGGMGKLIAEIVLGEETFVDPSQFDPSRFGEIDPFDPSFQRRCAEARSNKKGG